MPANLLDGKAFAARLRPLLKAAREALGPQPVRLISLEVGAHPAAAVYLRNQRRAADDIGIALESVSLPEGSSEGQVLDAVQRLNDDAAVTGIIVQRPLPAGVDARRVQAAIAPDKDVEGMNPANMGAILYSEPLLVPCTASAAQQLILETKMPLRGAEAVIVGHSEIVGKPIAILLLHHLATVTVCHVGTRKLVDHTRRADVLVVAVGKAGLVNGDMVKPGAVVVDIGINQTEDGRIVGDVDFASVAEVASWVTPVPGGVGPVTVAMLMRNALRAAGSRLV